MKLFAPYLRALTLLVCALVFSFAVQAQTSAFTYQGQLNDGASAANGTYQMQFSLFDAATGGTQAGTTVTNTTVSVLNGIFTVQLDFTAAPLAAGATRFLQIAVKKPADASYTTLTPRQQVTSSPYSIRTLNAGTSDALSAACAGCVTDSQIAGVSGSKVTGTVANATNAASATTATNAGNVTGTVAVANGGTGATSAVNVRTNLGLGTLATVTPTGTASATTFLRGDNSYAAIPSSGTGAPIFSTLASAVTVNSSTFVDIVSLNLQANKIYYFDGSIYGQRAAAATVNGTGNFRLTYTGTATTDIGIEQAGSLVPGTVFNATSFDYEAAGFSSTFTLTNGRRFNPTGFIRTTTAGTLTFKVARGATNTTVDLVVREGSFLRATPLN